MTIDNVPSSRYRRSIDGLRAVAILAVVGFHAFPSWVPGGFVGVDIFFVISGFLITGILLDHLQADDFSLIGFYARRIRRIFPALILVLAAIVVTGFFILWPGEYSRLGRHVAGGAGFIVNYLLQHETGYFQDKSSTKPALHLWSLGVEEQFYIFWPLLMMLGWTCRRHAGWVISGVLAASFVTNIIFVQQDVITDFYSPFSRFWELMAGGALAWAERHQISLSSTKKRDAAAIIGLASITWAVFHLTKNSDFPGWWALLPVGGAVALIAAGEEASVNRHLTGHKVLQAVGLISYPLYLWHWPLLSFAHILANDEPSRLLRIAMVTLAFVLAGLTYWFIEKPIRRRPPDSKLIGTLIVLMALLGISGLTIMLDKGVPSRFPDQTTQALDTDRLVDEWKRAVRMNRCHLQSVEADMQSDECIEKRRPQLLLWGDSHAASLYPGLHELQEKYLFGVTQLTQAGCPPLLDISKLVYRKNCNAINERILQQITKLQPDVVMLSSAWQHKDYPMDDETLTDELGNVITAIRQAAPHAKIVIVGPVPRWQAPLPAIYRRALSFGGSVPPQRMQDHIDPVTMPLDKLLAREAAQDGVAYISPQEYLCNNDGCLTRMESGLDSIAYLDNEHITPAVSIWLADRFSQVLLHILDIRDQ